MKKSIKEMISENVNLCSNPSELKITDIRVANINGAPKHCPLIKVYTNQGLVGYGEVRDASSATYALMLKSRLIGENPCNVDKLFRRIKQFGGPSRQGGGVSGIDIALWDLAGKAWGVPLWQMLGGKFRDKVRVYGDTDVDGKHTGADMGKAIKKRMDMGFTIVKMDPGVELLFDEPGCINAPLGMIEDCIKFAKRLEKYNIAWLEDIQPWHLTDHYVRIANNCNVPLATGEDIYLAENFRPLLENHGISVAHPDLLSIGGALEAKKLGDMCEKYGIGMAIHMAESPIACMVAIHTAAAIQNVMAVEFHSVDILWWNDLAIGIDNPLFKDGFVNVPNKPGLGIDSLNEELIAKHMHEKYPGQWESTDEWNNEWANDKEWS